MEVRKVANEEKRESQVARSTIKELAKRLVDNAEIILQPVKRAKGESGEDSYLIEPFHKADRAALEMMFRDAIRFGVQINQAGLTTEIPYDTLPEHLRNILELFLNEGQGTSGIREDKVFMAELRERILPTKGE